LRRSEALWHACWRPLLSAFCTLCLQLPYPNCSYALHVLQQLMLSPALPRSEKDAGPGESKEDVAAFWQRCIDDVMVPFMKHLAQKQWDPSIHPRFAVQFRQRALNLMVKVFLQRLTVLLDVKEFHVTLVGVIDTIQQYILLGKGTTLGEMALEALKNLLLVMHSTGAFSPETNPTGRELCNLAWAHIEPVCPGLRETLFPPKVDNKKKPSSEEPAQRKAVDEEAHEEELKSSAEGTKSGEKAD